MRGESQPQRGTEARPRTRATLAFIVVLWVVTLAAAVAAWLTFGPPPNLEPIPALSLLAVVAWWMGSRSLDRSVRVAVSHIVVLAAVAMCGPLVAAGYAAVLALGERSHISVRARVFNVAMSGLAALAAGLVYHWSGGVWDSTQITGALPLLRAVGLPLILADLTQGVINAALMAGILRLSQRTPVRMTLIGLVGAAGSTFLGYGVLAFLLVVLWLPGGMGWASILLIVAPLLGAWWAMRQFGEEQEAQSRALDVLVAAVEAKAPHLEGHSERVATLCAAMAEDLGLAAREVTHIRTAGMLHDLGQVALHHQVVESRGAGPFADAWLTYPRRGVDMLRGLSFLADSLDGIALHRTPPPAHALVLESEPWLAGQIVHLADQYDLLTTGRGPDRRAHTPDEAIAALARAGDPARERLVAALQAAVDRRPTRSTS